MRQRQEKESVMTDRLPLSALSDSELEQRLVDLGPRLYPPTPDLAMQVRHRLESEPVSTLTPTATTPATPRGHPAPGTRYPDQCARRGVPGLTGSVLPSPHAWGEGCWG